MKNKVKELGQVFTPTEVCNYLLQYLPENVDLKTIIDPFMGRGDFLKSFEEISIEPVRKYGIEIDIDAFSEAKKIDGELFLGDSFSTEIIEKLIKYEEKGFDLVVTNPPYVRYQNSKNHEKVSEKKTQLIEIINKFKWLNSDEIEFYTGAISSLSGLSDLSVLGTILSMALTSENGNLLIILPEAWFSRSYSKPPLNILLQFFEVTYVIEDMNKQWFKGSLIKTICLICRRKKSNKPTTNVKVFSNWRNNSFKVENEFYSFRDVKDFFSHFFDDIPFELRQIELKFGLPRKDILPFCKIFTSFKQGFKTGANLFFYLSLIENFDNEEKLRLSKLYDSKEIILNKKYLLSAIRNQSDYSSEKDYCSFTKGRLLAIPVGNTIQDKELLNYLKLAETTLYNQKRIQDLTAVKGNISEESEWYNLKIKNLQPLPNVFVPRVNDEVTNVFLTNFENERIVVDANFSVMHTQQQDAKVIQKLFKTNWVQLYLELIGTKLGGGALKIEAKHLNSILMPKLTNEEKNQILDDSLTSKELNHFFISVLYGDLNKNKLTDICIEIDSLLEEQKKIRRATSG